MKNFVKHTLAVALFSVAVSTLMAQGTPNADPDASVPVDGGILTVVGSAIAYGVYRVKNRKSTK